MQPSSRGETILPPPEFLSSITSTQLSSIVIDADEELDRVLSAIRDYDGALCQLSNQLRPSPGNQKLVLTLKFDELALALELEGALPDLRTVLPRFMEVGVLRVETAI
jgi:hypothetical protein